VLDLIDDGPISFAPDEHGDTPDRLRRFPLGSDRWWPRAEPMTDSAQLHDDRLLAERLRSGDRDALGELYDRYASVAMAVAVRVVSDRELAEDLVHDAYVAAWQKIDRFDPSRGSLRAWLLTIVRNRAIDRLRGTRPSIEVGEADEQSLLRTAPNPTWEAAVSRRSAAELGRALESLPDEQRQAVELAYFGGHTYREIATLTGVPQGTANGRLRLALAKLRDSLRLTDAAPLPVQQEPIRVDGMDR
jgi:RNA polymerase sigma-70 factor (ECF subfamily)